MFDITPKLKVALASGGVVLLRQGITHGWVLIAVAIAASTEAPHNE